jgi:hypothetical protein
MAASGIAGLKRPLGLSVPQDILVLPPPPDIPMTTAAFFGKNGGWWGRWKSPQVKGGYEAILIIREIKNASEARIVYLVPDYPDWYVSALRWETAATFTTRPDGKLVLRVPYSPAATTMDFWIEGKKMKGIIYGRYMRSDIILQPLT